MNSIKYTNSSFTKTSLFFISILPSIIYPVLSYFAYPIIELQGVIILAFFWLIAVLGIIVHLIASKNYFEITEKSIKISDGKSTVILDTKEVEDINTQALVAKKIGGYETLPYLVFKIDDKSKKKLKTLSSSKEYGFLQKAEDLTNYLGEDKGDIYFLVRNLKEDDFNRIKNFLDKSFTPLKPLIKTNSKDEYARIMKEYFE